MRGGPPRVRGLAVLAARLGVLLAALGAVHAVLDYSTLHGGGAYPTGCWIRQTPTPGGLYADGNGVSLAGQNAFTTGQAQIPDQAIALDNDIFLSKVDATDGSLVWNVTFGIVNQTDIGLDVAADAERGAVYVAGHTGGFMATPRPVPTHDAPNPSATDLLLVKLDAADGRTVWVVQWHFDLQQTGYADSVALDPSDGGAFVVGYVQTRNASLTRDWNTFAAKVGPDGQDVWLAVRGGPGISTETLIDVAFTQEDGGAVFAVGATDGAIEPSVPAHGGDDALLWRLRPSDGGIEWTLKIGTPANDRGNRVAVDSYEGVVVAAGITSGSFVPAGAQGGGDAWIAAYTFAGEERWRRQFGTSGSDRVFGLTAAGGATYLLLYTNGNFLVPSNVTAGLFRSVIVTLRTADGEVLEMLQLSSSIGAYTAVFDVSAFGAGNVVAAGSSADGLDGRPPDPNSNAAPFTAVLVAPSCPPDFSTLGPRSGGGVLSGAPAGVAGVFVAVVVLSFALPALAGLVTAEPPRAPAAPAQASASASARAGGGGAGSSTSGTGFSNGTQALLALMVPLQTLALLVRHNGALSSSWALGSHNAAYLFNFAAGSGANLAVKLAAVAAVAAADVASRGVLLEALSGRVSVRLQGWRWTPVYLYFVVPVSESVLSLVSESGGGAGALVAVSAGLLAALVIAHYVLVARRPDHAQRQADSLFVLPPCRRQPGALLGSAPRTAARLTLRQRLARLFAPSAGASSSAGCCSVRPHGGHGSPEAMHRADTERVTAELGHATAADTAPTARLRAAVRAVVALESNPLRWLLARQVVARVDDGSAGDVPVVSELRLLLSGNGLYHWVDLVQLSGIVVIAVALDRADQLVAATVWTLCFLTLSLLVAARRVPHSQQDALSGLVLVAQLLVLRSAVEGDADASSSLWFVAVSQLALVTCVTALQVALREHSSTEVAQAWAEESAQRQDLSKNHVGLVRRVTTRRLPGLADSASLSSSDVGISTLEVVPAVTTELAAPASSDGAYGDDDDHVLESAY